MLETENKLEAEARARAVQKKRGREDENADGANVDSKKNTPEKTRKRQSETKEAYRARNLQELKAEYKSQKQVQRIQVPSTGHFKL